jgi:hypothetical protein
MIAISELATADHAMTIDTREPSAILATYKTLHDQFDNPPLLAYTSIEVAEQIKKSGSRIHSI